MRFECDVIERESVYDTDHVVVPWIESLQSLYLR